MLILFFLLWVLISARFTVEVALFGVAVSAAIYWFCVRHMGYKPETDRKMVRKLFRGVRYALVLVWETLKANLDVSRFVFSRNVELEPQIIFFRTDLRSEVSRVALANSITLTPGTITVALNDDLFCVHCLNSHMAEGIGESVFVRELRKLEED